MDRAHDVLIPADTFWLHDPDVRRIYDVFSTSQHNIYFVGGCVRNAILRLPSGDVDMATDATPQRVKAIAEKADIQTVPTGIDHGTVTLIAGKTAVEVTTFREDIQTDGRRAVVTFSTDIAKDAARRDFTMNALYARFDRKVIDPLGGLDDLLAKRVRFIRDPDARIKEDYLRILRFFRFSAWYADPRDGFDPDALAAIGSNIQGLKSLPAERIGQEMVKMFGAPDPAMAVAIMRQTGVLHSCLPGADDRLLPLLIHQEMALGLSPYMPARLAILGGEDVRVRLRLSNAIAKEVDTLNATASSDMSLAEVAYRHGVSTAQRVAALRGAMAERLVVRDELAGLQQAAEANFPVKASDLTPMFQGRALGERLRYLEKVWIAADFKLTKEELLQQS
ncbi:MAG: CCA tRNA nucleotidyltransferase [Pseudomonadota bacterium]